MFVNYLSGKRVTNSLRRRGFPQRRIWQAEFGRFLTGSCCTAESPHPNGQMRPMRQILLVGSITLLALLGVACNGGSVGVLQPNPEDLCKCLPIEPDIADFRHLEKHVPIPNIARRKLALILFSVGRRTPSSPPTRHERGESLKCSLWRLHFYRKPASMRRTAMCTSKFLRPPIRPLPE